MCCDLLTSYRSTNITYDGIGNPLSYYNGTAYTFTWEGRQLLSAVTGGKTYTFTYNSEGIRTSKNALGVVTNYYLNGSQIIAEEVSGNVKVFLYDSTGAPIGMQYHKATDAEDAWEVFWYEKNLLGDVVAVYDNSGNKLISYTYDAWGNHTVSYENTAAMYSIAASNPFRYRGYYYDAKLKMYYLASRYYDPAVGRFISPDNESVITATPNALTDKNLYAYCDNNPVMRVDNGGEFWNYIIGGAVGAIVGGFLGGYTADKNGQDVLTGVLTGVALGAVAGIIVGSGNVTIISSGISSVASKAATDVIGAAFYGDKVGSWEDYSVAFVFGGLGGAVGKFGSFGKYTKDTVDIALRPLANQLVKMGTRGRQFDKEKYAYDVITRFATAGGSKSIISGSFGEFNLKVDIGKCFYRATTRDIYQYLR